MQIDRINFDDPDDPMTNDGAIRISFTPEAMFFVLPNGNQLTHDDQVAMGHVIRLAYEQGKRIGKLSALEEEQ